MKNKPIQIIIIILVILTAKPSFSFTQIPDDVNGRLWRLCKVWGLAKYYHENNCNVNWNTVLLEAIDSVLVSTSNSSFNSAIEALLTAAGPIHHDTSTITVGGDININAHFDWKDDTLFSKDVRNTLDSIVVNFRPRANCFVKKNDHSDPNFGGFLDFRNDYIFNIPSFSYTNESHRLLTFFYYWNIINYFHADKDLMDQSWDATLYQFTPLFRQVQTATDFHVLFYHLATYLNDSHGFTYSQLIYNYFGTDLPYIKIQYIENQTVVTKVGSGITRIAAGDIVKKVGGIEIAQYRDSLRQYALGSNESSVQLNLHEFMLRGPHNSTLTLELEDSSGLTYTSTIVRNADYNTYFTWANADPNAIWKITSCGYGYVDMGKLTTTDIPAMYAALKNTPAIIFDIRNYPNGTLWNLIPYFYTSPKTWALFTEPDLTFPGWYSWYNNQFDAGTFSNPNPYKGKVIILCNAETLSQAEYTVMGLQQYTPSLTIGSQTSGADGDVSHIDLPGGLTTTWTSLGIYYPDTSTAQRTGVRIDTIVTPTIEDIRHGKDVELLAALDCLTAMLNDPGFVPEITVFPNPASDRIYISGDFEHTSNIEIEIYNLLGQKIDQQDIQANGVHQIPFDISHWTDGIYFIKVQDEHGLFKIEKIIVQH